MGRQFLVKGKEFERVVTLVSGQNSDPVSGHVSVESPLGVALADAGDAETIFLDTPYGIQEYFVKRID